MTVAEAQTTKAGSNDVIAWRREQLGSRGYGEFEAMLLAHHVEVDLHQAIDLAGRGCPPELALRILL
jgi:hypothetical protein